MKRKRITFVESDYKTYFGSNEELKLLVSEQGADKFLREVLHFCKSRAEMSYLEAKEQFLRDVLLKPDEYFNSFLGCKIHRNHVKNLAVDTNS